MRLLPQRLRRPAPFDPEEVKRDGWREQGVLAVSVDDQRLTWPERELVRTARCTKSLWAHAPSELEVQPWVTKKTWTAA